jgi:hypothetical protein
MGEELTEPERAIYKKFTGGRERELNQRVEGFVVVKGRRAGVAGPVDCACYWAQCSIGTIMPHRPM